MPREVHRRSLGRAEQQGAAYVLVVAFVGVIGATYVIGRWLLHFLNHGAWGSAVLLVGAVIALGVAVWLRIPLAAYALAAAIGVVVALVPGNFHLLLP